MEPGHGLPFHLACRGRIQHLGGTAGVSRWAPGRSLWIGGMTLAALAACAVLPSRLAAIALFLSPAPLTLCSGHSLGLHRLLIHRSFAAAPLAGPGADLPGDAGRHGRAARHGAAARHAGLGAATGRVPRPARPPHDRWRRTRGGRCIAAWISIRPPRFVPEPGWRTTASSRWLEPTWMLQQAALGCAVLLARRVAVAGLGRAGAHRRIGDTGIGLSDTLHIARGPQGWLVDGVAVQGHDLPAAALITFGEAWHGNHHAWPESARLGLDAGTA